MTKENGYKEAGDRVQVINPRGFGEKGAILNNDGFGEVWVQLDSGKKFHGYEERDLIWEDEELPSEPISVEPSGPTLPTEVLFSTKFGPVILDNFTGGEITD